MIAHTVGSRHHDSRYAGNWWLGIAVWGGQPRETRLKDIKNMLNQYQYVWYMIAMEEAFRLSWIITL